jgi:hypothetical protein
MPPLDSFPKVDRIGYAYWIGLMYFNSENYALAEENLAICLGNTRLESNKALILTHLVPLRMRRGLFPRNELPGALEDVYRPFIDAIKRGDVKEFDLAVERGERRLIGLGVFACVLGTRMLCLRVLVKKM